jgi:DNA gyrase subunit A
VDDEWTPERRLRAARQREHVVEAVVVAQLEWRRVLELVETSDTAEAAQRAVAAAFGLTREQSVAVIDIQFRRISRADRDRIASELAGLRAEIAGLESEL